MKHSKLTKSRKKAIEKLYKFCAKNKILLGGTLQFSDNLNQGGHCDDSFDIQLYTHFVNIKCLPKKDGPDIPDPEFAYSGDDDNWSRVYIDQ